MSYLNDAPDRALQPPHDSYAEAFNEYDDMHVRAVVPYPLAPSVQVLLEMRNGMKEGDYLKDELDNLYRACREMWRDL